jgi:hypothetical protein
MRSHCRRAALIVLTLALSGGWSPLTAPPPSVGDVFLEVASSVC